MTVGQRAVNRGGAGAWRDLVAGLLPGAVVMGLAGLAITTAWRGNFARAADLRRRSRGAP